MGNKAITKRGDSVLLGSTEKQPTKSVEHYLAQLATALDVSLTVERIAIYIMALSDLSAEHLAHGFRHALKYFKPEFGVMFPVPAELRMWALEYKPEAERNSREIQQRGVKPDGWIPITKELVDEMWRQAKLKAEKDNPMIAADKGKSLHESQRAAALQRLGGSTMPKDPAKLAAWHHQTAIRQGWKQERQPGGDG